MSRDRRDVANLRQEMEQITDEKEKAALRVQIAKKTAEIQKREAWNQARIRGMQRAQRQMAANK